MTLSPALLERIRIDIDTAPYKAKTCRGKEWAALIGLSYAHMCRMLSPVSEKKRKTESLRPELKDWTKIIFAIKKSPPDGGGEISTDQAVDIAVKWGKVSADALQVNPGTFNRVARAMGLNKKQRRVSRFQADRPNRLHHFDASSSRFLYIARASGNDYILKIHKPGSGDYKNKPIPCDRLRPWYYGVVDDHSGRFHGSIFAAEGENGIHSLKTLCAAWSEIGLPEELLADQGMLKKNLISKELVNRLGVKLPESMPYAKEAHGKIERPWRTIWQRFERTFYVGEWKKFEISLAEFETHFRNFVVNDYNLLPHRFEKDITKLQAWNRINLHGGIVKIPENALMTAAKRKDRTVGADGIFEYEGKSYEVKGLHSAKVIVFEGVFDDRFIVQDKADGKKYEVKKFLPLNIGEFRTHADTPHQRLIKESAAMLTSKGPMLYSDKEKSHLHPSREGAEKVIEMPIKTKEIRQIDDPFDIDSYPSMQEAMREFCAIVGTFIPQDQREVIAEQIEASGLSKTFVENFALEVRAQLSRRAAM